MADGSHIKEGLVGRNGVGECAFGQRPVGLLDGAGQPGHCAGMQHTEADAVAPEVGKHFPVHRKAQGSIRAAVNLSVPGEVDVPPFVTGAKADAEAVAPVVDREIGQFGGDCVPVVVAHGHIQSVQKRLLQNRTVTGADVAQIAAGVEQRKRPGAQGNLFWQVVVAAVAEEVGGERSGHWVGFR